MAGSVAASSALSLPSALASARSKAAVEEEPVAVGAVELVEDVVGP
jgi:hypothetical protein